MFISFAIYIPINIKERSEVLHIKFTVMWQLGQVIYLIGIADIH